MSALVDRRRNNEKLTPEKNFFFPIVSRAGEKNIKEDGILRPPEKNSGQDLIGEDLQIVTR